MEIPHLNWTAFTNSFRWSQGEHIGLIGPTGQGKTTLAQNLLPLRQFTVIFATKPEDDSLERLIKNDGYVKIKKWETRSPTLYPKRILWPNARDLNSEMRQQIVFGDALRKIYREGRWTVYLDELWFMTNMLNFGKEVKMYLLQARSLKISLLISAQRPKWIPLEVFDQSTHLFFFRDNDRENLSRISGIGDMDADIIRHTVARLEQYEVLYINTRTGAMVRTRGEDRG